MFPGPEHRRDSDPRSADVRARSRDSGFWHRIIGRNRSGREDVRGLYETRRLLRADRRQYDTGLRWARNCEGRDRRRQRPKLSIVLGGIVLMLACGLGCSRHDSPQASFQQAQQTLRHGDLIRAQDEAEQGYQRFRTTEPEWARKFQNLEAEALLLRGLYSQGLSLLESDRRLPETKDSIIEVLVLKGAAHARLHHFTEAEQNIRMAEELCGASPEIACGGVFRVRGILSLQQGQPGRAKHFFEQTLDFGRLHGDQFLEATALLNLGLGALQEQHYDEAIDRTDAAYRVAAFLDAGTIATKALGNLGWAYYNLGDSEKSLELSLEAENRAIQASDVIDQLSWITNAGYVHDQLHDFPRAKQSYLKALGLARNSEGREDIYNALRALALVSVESGEVEE